MATAEIPPEFVPSLSDTLDVLRHGVETQQISKLDAFDWIQNVRGELVGWAYRLVAEFALG